MKRQSGEVTVLVSVIISALTCFAHAWATAHGFLPAPGHTAPAPQVQSTKG